MGRKWIARLFVLAGLLILTASIVPSAMAAPVESPSQALVTPQNYTDLPLSVRANFEGYLCQPGILPADMACQTFASEQWAQENNYKVVAANGRTFEQELADSKTAGGAFNFLGYWKKPWLAAQKWVVQVGGPAKDQPAVVQPQAKSAEELACTATFTNNRAASTLNVTGPANLQLFSLEDGRHIRFRVPAGEAIRVQNKAYALWQYPSACPAVKVEQQMRDGAVRIEGTNTDVAPSGAVIVIWEELWTPNSPYKGWVTR